jgi:hypothetical protein
MKNKIFILLGTIIFSSCGNEPTKEKLIISEQKQGRIIYDYGARSKVRVFEVDSCEYIGFDSGLEGGNSIIHKQNCKFCIERNKK